MLWILVVAVFAHAFVSAAWLLYSIATRGKQSEFLTLARFVSSATLILLTCVYVLLR